MGDKVADETDYRDALPVNMYAVQRKINGADGYMVQEPGLTLFATGIGADRGGFWSARLNSHFRVSGERFIEILANGSVVNIGEIKGSNQASIAESFNNIAIVADGGLYYYNRDGGLRLITNQNVGTPIDIAWIDNYFFLTDGENIFHSDIANEENYRALDFATSEFVPDATNGVIKTQDNRALAINRFSAEYYQNDGTDNFSFARLAGRAWEVGAVGTHAKCKIQSSIYFVGNYKSTAFSVYVSNGGQPQRIATREIEKLLGNYNQFQLSGIRVEGRVEDEYQSLIIHLPNETLKCNLNLGSWSILKSTPSIDYGAEVYRAINGVYDERVGAWIYGDKINGNIGRLDDKVSTHYGDLNEITLFTPYYPIDGASVDKMEIEIIPGFTDFNDATVFFSTTEDGWVYSGEFLLEYGAPNDFKKRFYKRRLGYVRDKVSFKLRAVSRSRMAFGVGVIDYG